MLNICSTEEEMVERAKSIYEHMIEKGVNPDSSVYAAIINCCRARRDLKDGERFIWKN